MNDPIRRAPTLMVELVLAFSTVLVGAQTAQIEDLATLTPGRTKAVNALWTENPLAVQFKSTNRIVVANIQGPAEITMMHFAYGRAQLGKDPKKPLSKQIGNGQPLNRDLILRIYWNGETNPSVECPFVDFFCDPDGAADVVSTALVNGRRGFNEYFPMPFRRSARVELDYEGPTPPGDELQHMMPCYSYVCYRALKKFPKNMGYFHASWRQDSLLLGQRDYTALEAAGKGKFVGWNVTLYPTNGCPVDANEKFYIDGETNASVEFQGLEDSVGFSWGFPTISTFFPLTGYSHFQNGGGAAYRFFLSDAISFEKSLKVAVGFGPKEKAFQRQYSKPDSTVRLSSTVYWYQTEPHAPFPPLPPVDERAFARMKAASIK
jgi:D-arabinan exo alpha-(1,3)/(1,5)-arabinofuranosidase (non-reducing end)